MDIIFYWIFIFFHSPPPYAHFLVPLKQWMYCTTTWGPVCPLTKRFISLIALCNFTPTSMHRLVGYITPYFSARSLALTFFSSVFYLFSCVFQLLLIPRSTFLLSFFLATSSRFSCFCSKTVYIIITSHNYRL